VSENGQPRKVSMEIKCGGHRRGHASLSRRWRSACGLFAGFVTSARNGRGLLFHITTVELPADLILSTSKFYGEVSHGPTPR
jgi:primosomal replication protein N